MFISRRINYLGWLSASAVVCSLIIFSSTPAAAKEISSAAPFTKAELLLQVNKVRTEAGLPKLVAPPTIGVAAESKVTHLMSRQYFAHIAKDGSASPWYFLTQAGYRFTNAGENLAIDFTTATAVVDAMMASPAHRSNLLGAKYRDIGIGVSSGPYAGKRSTMVVMLFGSTI
jgi:uncharacterized protein YkwD